MPLFPLQRPRLHMSESRPETLQQSVPTMSSLAADELTPSHHQAAEDAGYRIMVFAKKTARGVSIENLTYSHFAGMSNEA